MKKLLCVILAAVMVLSLAACSGSNNPAGGNGGVEIADSLALLTTVWDSYTEDEKFPAAGGDYENNVMDGPGGIDISTLEADELDYLLALNAEGAALIDDAASLTHMMNANTFTCGAFRAQKAENVETLAKSLRDNIQQRQWMCGFPDKLVIFTLDRYVVSVFGKEEITNTFRDKLTACYPSAVIAYEEAIV